MSPRLAANNSADHRVVNTELGSYLLQGDSPFTVSLTNGDHHLFSEFVAAISSFFNGILAVILRGSQEKVVRPDTWRIIATMADMEPFGDCPVGHLPGKPSSQLAPAARTIDLAVSEGICRTDPEPTLWGFLNVAPKAFFDGNSPEKTGAGSRAEAVIALLKKVRACIKELTAVFAVSGDSDTLNGHLEPLFLGAVAPDSSTYRGAFLIAQR